MNLIERARALCWAIEELPASEKQTAISLKASFLLQEIKKLTEQKCQNCLYGSQRNLLPTKEYHCSPMVSRIEDNIDLYIHKDNVNFYCSAWEKEG